MGYKEFIYTRKLPNEQNIIKYCMRIEIKGNQCGRWGLRVQRIEIINKIITCICGPPLPIPQILGFFCLFVGHSVYQLDVGSQFPNQGLNPGPEWWKHWILTYQGWSLCHGSDNARSLSPLHHQRTPHDGIFLLILIPHIWKWCVIWKWSGNDFIMCPLCITKPDFKIIKKMERTWHARGGKWPSPELFACVSNFHLKLNITNAKASIPLSWKSIILPVDDVIFLVTETRS